MEFGSKEELKNGVKAAGIYGIKEGFLKDAHRNDSVEGSD